MRERRWCRPRDDYLNLARSLSWFVITVALAGPTCAHQQPFNEFLAGGGGDEKVPAHFTQLHNYHRPNDFFGSLGQHGDYSSAAAANVDSASHQEPTSSEETATDPPPIRSDKDGGDHFEAPDPVSFEGHKVTDGNPDWEMLRHPNPYKEPYQYTEYDFGNYPDYSAYTYDDESYGEANDIKTDEKRPEMGLSHDGSRPSPEEIDQDMSKEDLQTFLSQFYLIKTQHGYILGRSLPAVEFPPGDLSFSPSQAQQQFQQLHSADEPREEGLTKRKSNFQLRVRKRYDPSIFYNSSVDKRSPQFQLRVRKDDKRAPNFQLRVRRELIENMKKRARSFQLRVRKSGNDDILEAKETHKRSPFQLRVRKDDDDDILGPEKRRDFQLGNHGNDDILEADKRSPFQLRVRKDDGNNMENMAKRARSFQLRVRKNDEALDEESKRSPFQLRVRKGEEGLDPEKEAGPEKRGRSFQLRVRKSQDLKSRVQRAPNFQLRVRKASSDEKRSRHFQLRVRRGEFDKRARSFQLRVRRGPSAQLSNKRGVHNFQLRVRKDYQGYHGLPRPQSIADLTAKRGRSFQLRVRKSDEEAPGDSRVRWFPAAKRARDFQLRVRKAEEGDKIPLRHSWSSVTKRNWQRPLRRSSSFQLRVRKKSSLPEEFDLSKRGQFQLRV